MSIMNRAEWITRAMAGPRDVPARAVLLACLGPGTLTREDLAAVTGLTRPEADDALARLIAAGHVRRIGCCSEHPDTFTAP
jgi:hypothetical protein